MDDSIFIYLTLIPVLGIAAQVIAWWIRVPSILLLLTFGVVLGIWLNPDELLVAASADESLGAKVIFPSNASTAMTF